MAETSINLEVISFRFFVFVFIYMKVESLDSYIKGKQGKRIKENKSSNIEQSLESRIVTNSRFL